MRKEEAPRAGMQWVHSAAVRSRKNRVCGWVGVTVAARDRTEPQTIDFSSLNFSHRDSLLVYSAQPSQLDAYAAAAQ